MVRSSTPKSRPTIFVDQHGRRLTDADGAELGLKAPLGRERLVSCLPFADGPRRLVVPTVIVDRHGGYVIDPDGDGVGRPGVWVSRMISAGVVTDTRRL